MSNGVEIGGIKVNKSTKKYSNNEEITKAGEFSIKIDLGHIQFSIL